MTLSRPYILMWTIVGLVLTIGASFLPLYITNAPWQWIYAGVSAHPLGFKCQVGAVLLVSCLGGRTAGMLAQIAYLLLGLLWLKVFNDGGGIEYLQRPAFGYLLAFIPGAWMCGQLAFKRRYHGNNLAKPQLEHLGLSCLCGIVTIHLFGIIYLLFFHAIELFRFGRFSFFDSLLSYSIYPILSHLVLGCVATSVAFIMRRILLY